MRKIVVKFNKPKDIENLRTIMKNVYARDIKSIEDSISLVVTHVSPNKNIQNIKES